MRTAQVFSFARRRVPRDWSAQDVAEFYRVEGILAQSGLRVTSVRGVTDEGDPWFVFCRADDDEVIIHFARIDGRYVISSPAYCGNGSGYDFRALVRGMIERNPVLQPKPSGDNLLLHPAALLVMLVASAFLKSGHAAEIPSTHGTGASAGPDAAAGGKSRAAAAPGVPATPISEALDATQQTLLLSAINAAIVASVPEHTIASATPPAQNLPDVTDSPPTAFAAEIVLDRPHDQRIAGSSSILTPLPPSIAAAPVDLAANPPMHSASSNDAMALKLSSPDPLTFQSQPGAGSILTVTAAVGAAPDPAAGVQHVSLSGLTDIPQADKI